MSQKAKITVYLQALGAHYLGAHAYKVSNIKIQFVQSGRTTVLPYIVGANSNDGTPTTQFTPGVSSFMPIMTVQAQQPLGTAVHFLSPDALTVCGNAVIDLPSNIESAYLKIKVPVTSGSKPIELKYPVILDPTLSEYTITVVVPGLYVTANEITDNTISAFVKMMCGCPVTMDPVSSLWPANDFVVTASVLDTSGDTKSYQLSYQAKQPANSLFSAALSKNQKQIRSVLFSASQKSTGNYGVVKLDLS